MRRVKIDNFKQIGKIWQEEERGTGVGLEKFVKLLYKFVPHESHERIKVINGCIKLYRDLDIHCENNVAWHEFTQYISDQVHHMRR